MVPSREGAGEPEVLGVTDGVREGDAVRLGVQLAVGLGLGVREGDNGSEHVTFITYLPVEATP
jgi:hypothetical protein